MNQKSPSTGCIAGLDEAGRGPWAGPVVVGAVILPKGVRLPNLRDSKKLSESQREALYVQIIRKTVWAVGEASQQEIDHFGLRRATEKAFRRAINGLNEAPDHLMIDGRDHFQLPIPATYIIRGDDKIRSISAASIVAKVTRDRIMKELASQYPHHAFEQHKGYGTQQHQRALARHGITPLHRRSYAPIQTYC